jgi:N-acetylmuramoyl-L-alanine amidase
MAKQSGGHAAAAFEEASGAVPMTLRLVVVVSIISALGSIAHGMRRAADAPEGEPSAASLVVPTLDPSAPSGDVAASGDVSPEAPADPASAAAPARVGIVAGHWGSDTGATCEDGLTEVEVNLDVAQRVVLLLQALGYQTDLLEEFDPQLEGYQADALVSIHADSCQAFPNATPPASGFKVASVEDSRVPEEEARLVSCLASAYAAKTGMYYHANSITEDMSRYHTFYEIDGQTPAAIIEAGFMHADRQMLTQQAGLVAQGIVDGIVCFLEQ